MGCEHRDPPPTAGNVTKDVGEFLLGFTEGLGRKIGFSDCLDDLDAVYRDILAIVDFFEHGINGRIIPTIAKAFEVIGQMIKDFGTAISVCAKDAAAFGAKMKTLGQALSGNALSVIKVVVKELVHIFHERNELTADCKATAADWRGQDFEGSGKAVGDIVGVILNGLEADAEASVMKPAWDPSNCPSNAQVPSTCWADSAYQKCAGDRQGAYDAVMKAGSQEKKYQAYLLCGKEYCLHAEDAADHKCTQACATAKFSTKGVSTAGTCPAKYDTVDRTVTETQCPDGVTQLRYCP